MAQSGAGAVRPLGGMQPDPELLGTPHATELVRVDGRPQPPFRDDLRRIPSWRNAWAVVWTWTQTVGIIALAVWWGNPIGYVLAFLLMGRADAEFAALMHEAAHRLLFANKRWNDLIGRWVVGYPMFTSTDVYRRVHMAHHRHEFGPEEPDIPLYSGYPITHASFRRKLLRDATGQTAVRLFRDQFGPRRWKDARSRRTLLQILFVQAVLLGICIVTGHWWVYPVLWLLPYMTVWRVINRLRSIAEHGGMDESRDPARDDAHRAPAPGRPVRDGALLHRLAPPTPRRRGHPDARLLPRYHRGTDRGRLRHSGARVRELSRPLARPSLPLSCHLFRATVTEPGYSRVLRRMFDQEWVATRSAYSRCSLMYSATAQQLGSSVRPVRRTSSSAPWISWSP